MPSISNCTCSILFSLCVAWGVVPDGFFERTLILSLKRATLIHRTQRTIVRLLCPRSCQSISSYTYTYWKNVRIISLQSQSRYIKTWPQLWHMISGSAVYTCMCNLDVKGSMMHSHMPF